MNEPARRDALPRRRPTVFPSALVLIAGLILLSSTAFGSSGNSVMDRIEHADKEYDNNSVAGVLPVEAQTVTARERHRNTTFEVLARKPEMKRYPCSSCHVKDPGPGAGNGSAMATVNARRGAQLTHGDITLNHGQSGTLSCIDCHSSDRPDLLEDKQGNSIDYNHSYRLCGQCHFRQKSDWIGGAHGKRVDNWAGERVIFNCTSCHDPHSPRFEKRYPATYSPPAP